jgi:hypothetical protein
MLSRKIQTYNEKMNLSKYFLVFFQFFSSFPPDRLKLVAPKNRNHPPKDRNFNSSPALKRAINQEYYLFRFIFEQKQV